ALGSEEKFSVVPLPKSPKTGKLNILSTDFTGTVIFAESKKKDEAWKLISYISSEEGNSAWNIATGTVPINSAVMKHEWVQKSTPIKMALKVLTDPMTTSYMNPIQLPNYIDIVNGMDPIFQQFLAGDISSKEFLDTWANKMTKALKDYNAAVKK
ncbi:MAG: extracellular solute-binding protein, partial [Candidatus Coatesbacteria bacterium]|nr:extracellular solute-binding protein [Candidatus Coatesbacteria bacterium]